MSNSFATPWTVRHQAPWVFLGEDAGVGCHFLLQGIFPTQRRNPHLLHCQEDSLPLSHRGSPFHFSPACKRILHIDWCFFKLPQYSFQKHKNKTKFPFHLANMFPINEFLEYAQKNSWVPQPSIADNSQIHISSSDPQTYPNQMPNDTSSRYPIGPQTQHIQNQS